MLPLSTAWNRAVVPSRALRALGSTRGGSAVSSSSTATRSPRRARAKRTDERMLVVGAGAGNGATSSASTPARSSSA